MDVVRSSITAMKAHLKREEEQERQREREEKRAAEQKADGERKELKTQQTTTASGHEDRAASAQRDVGKPDRKAVDTGRIVEDVAMQDVTDKETNRVEVSLLIDKLTS